MSNLYKQYFVHTETENKRVINSNALIEERLAKVLELQKREQRRAEGLNDGFSAGIIQNDTEVFEEAEEDTSVMKASEEAEQILADAKAEAEAILEAARQQAVTIREEAKTQGYEEGAMQKIAELEAIEVQNAADFETKKRNLEAEHMEKMKNMESELVDVILEVFNKVFHIQFDNKKHILMHLINDAILNIEGDKKFRIKVADSNVQFLENHREDILERVGHGIELEFIADSSMVGNDCVIETDSGVFDCSLGTQLENLIKDIRSLCS